MTLIMEEVSAFETSVSFYTHRRDDGGSNHFWNVGKLLRHYKAQHFQKTVIFTLILLFVAVKVIWVDPP
jgi:hypothetical protein